MQPTKKNTPFVHNSSRCDSENCVVINYLTIFYFINRLHADIGRQDEQGRTMKRRLAIVIGIALTSHSA